MAVKLVLEFNDAGGTSRKWSFSNADNNVATSSVKALMNGMIANGSIFAHPPVTKVGAKLVVTTETGLDVRD